MVAAKLSGRNSIGIDISSETIEIARKRLENPVKSNSNVFTKGRDSYSNETDFVKEYLTTLNYTPVKRNSRIDAFLKTEIDNKLVPIRFQRFGESIYETASTLNKAVQGKQIEIMIVISTYSDSLFDIDCTLPEDIIIDSTSKSLNSIISDIVEKRKHDVHSNDAIKPNLGINK